MRTTEQLRADLSRLTLQHMGFDGAAVDQQTDEWSKMKLGVLSASRAKEIVSKGEMRGTYMLELIAEIATGKRKEISAKSLDWGNENESSCIGWYEFDSGVTVDSIPFVYKDDAMRAGCSPDGLIGDRMGIEAKNPWNTAVYLAFALDGKIKPEYIEQVQFSMWVTGREQWVFACHDPRVLNYCAHSVVIDRDDARMRLYDDAVPAFVAEMDAKLAKLGYTFGDQWK